MKKYNNNQQLTINNITGFTLIEALVVIAIIITMTSVLTLNYPSMRNKFALLRSAHQLAQDLRRAQEMATSAKKLEATGDVPYGYGIYLVEGTGQVSYRLYADTYPSVSGDQQYTTNDITVATINLENKIYIQDISGATAVSINFKGPDPVTNISSGANEVTIMLAIDINTIQDVVVNKAGLIYVK